jgi:hypothetical protein
MARQCIFCGDSPLTSEHVPAQWISRLFPDTSGVFTITSREDRTIVRAWWSEQVSRVARFVCRRCNNEWMGQLENEMIPLLTGMILIPPEALSDDPPPGRGRLLSPHDQGRLALWAVKTAMVLDYTDSLRIRRIPSEHRRWLFENQRPPPNTFVWLAGYSEGEMIGIHRARAVELKVEGVLLEGVETYLSTFSIGPLVLQVIGTTYTGPLDIDIAGSLLEGGFEEFVVRIWPTGPSLVEWPPDLLLDTDALESFVQADLTNS